VAVSKKQPVEKIQAAIQAGVRILGENYPEEAQAKIELIHDAVEWHMIGHLQSRKARIIAGSFHAIHSVDSLRTAQKLEQALIEADRSMTILFEVGLAGEDQKHGYDLTNQPGYDQFLGDIEEMQQLTHLKPVGLMVMPPYAADAEASRPYFAKGRSVLEDLNQRYPSIQWTELSMGTSQDYLVAVQEGATLVRVGTAIFGER
jgi:PLP dependent protein